jgi:hypothetical protein
MSQPTAEQIEKIISGKMQELMKKVPTATIKGRHRCRLADARTDFEPVVVATSTQALPWR